MSSTLKVDILQDSGGNNLVTSNGSGVITSAGFGKVLQVVTSSNSTQLSTTSTSFVAGFSTSITPSSSSSKILILASTNAYINTATKLTALTVFRGGVASGTNLGNATYGFGIVFNGNGSVAGDLSIAYLDSPATTSSTTYELGFRVDGGTGYININGARGAITLMEILP